MKLLDVMTRIVFAGTVACAMAVAAPVSADAEELPWKWDDTNHPADVKTSAAGTIEGSLDAAWRIFRFRRQCRLPYARGLAGDRD